jgi:hypothetical protein
VTGASFAANFDDACALEDVEVAGDGRPGVREAVSEVARGELGAEMSEQHDDVTACGVGEGVEDSLELLEVFVRRGANY